MDIVSRACFFISSCTCTGACPNNPLTPMPALSGRDEPWHFFHFWRHHFWPKLASSIPNFCRRKQSWNDAQIWVIRLMEPRCISHRQPKLTTCDSCLRAVLYYKQIYKGLDACQRFFLKRRENVMFSNKIDLPYCLVVFFVVCPRLRPFWSVFGELACFWCSTAKITTRQHKDFRSNQECPSLEANNSAGKITPGLNSSTHSKQRCCSSMSIHSLRKLYLPQITSDAFISCSIGFRILVSFGVVLMSCRVNFHVVRSALQYSACENFICLLFIFAWR